MIQGISISNLLYDTNYINCTGKILNRKKTFSSSSIQGSSWCGLIKAGPEGLTSKKTNDLHLNGLVQKVPKPRTPFTDFRMDK